MDPRSIQAVVVTHEHTDHAKGAAAGAARWGWQIYATAGTRGASLALAESQTQTLVANEPVTIGDVRVHPVSTSHDATDPIAVIATDAQNGRAGSNRYDLGIMYGAQKRSRTGDSGDRIDQTERCSAMVLPAYSSDGFRPACPSAQAAGMPPRAARIGGCRM